MIQRQTGDLFQVLRTQFHLRYRREPATLEGYRRSHEIALAEFDAAMAQDVVGGGSVEIEIRQTEVEQERLPFELALSARKLDNDLLVLGAVDLHRLEGLDEINGLRDAVLDLGEARFIVGKSDEFHTGEPGGAADGMICYRAQLPHQRKHVRIKPHVEERCWLDLLRLAMRSRLVEHRRHAGEELRENGHGNLVHGDRHGMRVLCWWQYGTET